MRTLGNKFILAFAIIAALANPPAAWAKNDKNEWRGRDHSERDYRRHYRADRDSRIPVFVNMNSRDITVVRDRIEPYYYRNCPPGLAKKHNGCMPPGQLKHYVIGQPLPTYVEYWAVPQDVLVLLPPAPAYAQYVWVDKDILLVSEASKKVLDALVLFSAVN